MLTILSVAYPFAPVSLDCAGGAEQILALLDRGLVAAGHRSLVIAAEGSHVRGELIPVRAADPETTYARWRSAIEKATQSEPIDLIHFHGLDFCSYLPPEGPPVLATLHLPPSFYPDSVFHIKRPRTRLNCVSHSQLAACPPSSLLAGVVENGVPLDLLATPDERRAGYALAIGRICPEKGYHLALDAAEKAGVPLYLAGQVFPFAEHQRYWKEMLEPRLSLPHRYLGPVGLAEKVKLLASAECLLVPSLVPETSSLVSMEALACGTPVVAFRSGALPEVVENGRTGFIVNDAAQMAVAIPAVETIDRHKCKATAQRRFSSERMLAAYLELYSKGTIL